MKTIITSFAAIILALSLSASLGCAFQAGPFQGALGNTSVERTEEDGTATKTSGAELSPPFVDFLKEIVDAAARLIPGNGDNSTTINVTGSDVDVIEEE
ncbi:hypothetical protein LCGC14_1323840 [marine sediment metagenome]|uniref:Uncharacterized protein n=1 Tax=marine sediment metagenome TaxID=412755 RepID=A0A0F9KIP4_9ZZZZ